MAPAERLALLGLVALCLSIAGCISPEPQESGETPTGNESASEDPDVLQNEVDQPPATDVDQPPGT